MKTSEMRTLNLDELKKQLDDSHQELFNLRFRASTRQLVNHREIRRVRRNIARINTLIREKELELANSAK
ncbi:50S ribosomal protein L29 [Chloroflexota bacterium]